MSGMRQMIAVCLVLVAFDLVINKKMARFIVLIVIACFVHTSAIIFLPVYLLKDMTITQKKGAIYLVLTISFIILRVYLVTIIELLTPTRYLLRYQILSNENSVNILLVVIAIAIPLVCIILWDDKKWAYTDTGNIMSLLYIISLLNAFLIFFQ